VLARARAGGRRSTRATLARVGDGFRPGCPVVFDEAALVGDYDSLDTVAKVASGHERDPIVREQVLVRGVVVVFCVTGDRFNSQSRLKPRSIPAEVDRMLS
jgi:hypothetical protein